jgi:hypothetical protein
MGSETRILEAARDLARAEQARRDYVGAVDWTKCERGYEDGRSVCAQEAGDLDVPYTERCSACQRNRDLLDGAKAQKIRRRNAINRIVRAAARAKEAK